MSPGWDRRPNVFVSARVAATVETRADYIKKRAFDKNHYKSMILAYLEEFGEARREDIDTLVLSKLSDALSEGQKRRFVANLLQEMRREAAIRSDGTTRGAKWILSKPASGKSN